MVRKQFFFDRAKSRRLKARAAELGVSEAEFVRQGIKRVLDATGEGAGDWRQRLIVALDQGRPLDGLVRRVETAKEEQADRRRARLARARNHLGGR